MIHFELSESELGRDNEKVCRRQEFTVYKVVVTTRINQKAVLCRTRLRCNTFCTPIQGKQHPTHFDIAG